MAGALPAWNMARMAGNKRPDKKSDSERRAAAIYDRLMKMDRPLNSKGLPMSNNDWTKAAGVSTSFFTNLTTTDKRAGSEPVVGNLRAILDAAGSSIPEFFLHEAQGRLVPAPTRQALEQAFADAWDGVVGSKDKRIAYLAGTVLQLLGLPDVQRTRDQTGDQGAPEEGAQVRQTTRRA